MGSIMHLTLCFDDSHFSLEYVKGRIKVFDQV